MKFLQKKGLLLVLASLVLVSACKKGDDPQPIEQVQLGKLVKVWNIESAFLGAVDRSNDFTNFKLELKGSFGATGGVYQYTVTGTRPSPSPWPASGTWKFGAEPTSSIIRDSNADEVLVTYVLSADGQTLTLDFTVPTGSTGWPGSARTEQVEGDWTFTFTSN